MLVKPGLALDHAAMMRAALALHEARNLPGLGASRDYLADAIRWADALESWHVDPRTGLLCMSASDAGDVILRLAPTADDAIPNAHPVYLSALVRLAGLTGEARLLARADALFAALAASVRANPIGHAGVFNALDFRLRAKEIVTAGPRGGRFMRPRWRRLSAAESSLISTGRRICRRGIRPMRRRRWPARARRLLSAPKGPARCRCGMSRRCGR